MNQTWLIVTELMRRRSDLNKDFLHPYRRKIERALSIPEKIVNDADLEGMNLGEELDKIIKPLGIRRLKPNEREKK